MYFKVKEEKEIVVALQNLKNCTFYESNKCSRIFCFFATCGGNKTRCQIQYTCKIAQISLYVHFKKHTVAKIRIFSLSNFYSILDTLIVALAMSFSKITVLQQKETKTEKFLENYKEFVGIFLINAKVHRTLTLLLKEKKTQHLPLKFCP